MEPSYGVASMSDPDVFSVEMEGVFNGISRNGTAVTLRCVTGDVVDNVANIPSRGKPDIAAVSSAS